MKREGSFKDIPVYSDPACPPGMVYMMNNLLPVSVIDVRSRWQRIKDWFRGLLHV